MILNLETKGHPLPHQSPQEASPSRLPWVLWTGASKTWKADGSVCRHHRRFSARAAWPARSPGDRLSLVTPLSVFSTFYLERHPSTVQMW